MDFALDVICDQGLADLLWSLEGHDHRNLSALLDRLTLLAISLLLGLADCGTNLSQFPPGGADLFIH